MTKFSIAITSDTICPWCYVGKRQLEAGIRTYQSSNSSNQDTFSISWHPYYLNPSAPAQAEDKNALYDSIHGRERRIASQKRLSDIGRPLGIEFKWGGLSGRTRDSHRLIAKGGSVSNEMQNKVVNGLFRAYFEEERDISDHSVLKEIAMGAGLDGHEVDEVLAGNGFGDEVDSEVEDARRRGVSGVPNFLINGRYEIPGAQDAEGFSKVFSRIAELEANR